MSKKSFLLFLLVLQFYSGISLVLPNSLSDDEKLIELIKKYPKEKVVILESENIVTFIRENNKAPYVLQEQIITFQSLKPNVQIDKVLDYDMFSEIVSYSFAGKSAKLVNRACGNVEIEGIFHSDKKICKYTFQFSQIGTLAKLKLVKRYNDLKFYTSEFFHDTYPVIIKSISIIIPPEFNVELHDFNFDRFGIEKSQTMDKKGNNIFTYKIQNVMPHKDEKYEMGYSHNYPHIIIQAKSFRDINGINFSLIKDLNDLYNWYATLINSLKNDTAGLLGLTEKIIGGRISDNEKVKAVYYWVQDNIRYCAIADGMAGYKPEEAITVFKNRYGDCKGMANLTKNLLKFAGFDARLCWLGTNHLKYDYSVPSLVADNHMICCVILDSDTLFLDATETLCSFGDYAERIQGRQVLIENGDSYIVSHIPVQTLNDHSEHRKLELRLENNHLIGNAKNVYLGEKKRNVLQTLYYAPRFNYDDIIRKLVLNEQKEYILISHNLNSIPDRDSTLNICYSIQSKQQVKSFESKYYIDIDFFKDFNGFYIEPDRISDINLNMKSFQKTDIVFYLPENYTIDEIPVNAHYDNDIFNANIKYDVDNLQIKYTKVIEIKKPVIKRNEFSEWSEFVKFLENSYKKNIVLKPKINE